MTVIKLRKMSSEKDIKENVKRILNAYNWFWFMPPASAYGRSGISDILAIHPGGTFLAVETKFGYNKPTPLQIGFISSVMSHRSFGFVVNENSISFFQQWVEAFERAAQAVAEQRQVDPVDGSLMLNAIKVLTDPLT